MALAASDREGFNACGEEDRGERPARYGSDSGTGGYRRVAAPRPHRRRPLGANRDGRDNGDWSGTLRRRWRWRLRRRDGWREALTALWGIVSFASGGGGGGDALVTVKALSLMFI